MCKQMASQNWKKHSLHQHQVLPAHYLQTHLQAQDRQKTVVGALTSQDIIASKLIFLNQALFQSLC